jgi:hypothetical protein
MTRFVENVTAFVDALGMDEPGIVLYLANVPWQSEADRQDFIDYLTREV